MPRASYQLAPSAGLWGQSCLALAGPTQAWDLNSHGVMKATLSLPCEAHGVTVGSTQAQASQRQESSLPQYGSDLGT